MRLALCAFYLFIGAVIFAAPDMSRRELLFAVPVPSDYRGSPAGRRAVSIFRAVVAAALLAGFAALLFTPARYLSIAAVAAPLSLSLAGGVTYYRQNRRIAPSAIQITAPRELQLSTAPEKLPAFAWLAAGPFAILATAAVWLYLHWDRIPARFAVHFGADGQPNRWVDRCVKSVYGPLFFGVELSAIFVVLGLSGWYGARRSHSRPVMLGCVIAIEYMMSSLFSLIGVQATLGIPVWAVVLSPTLILIPTILVMARKLGEPWEPLDPTPNECWKGDIYYNPNDAALFVEKRMGWGYTFNFANGWAWVLLLALLLVIASAPLVIA